MIRPSRPEQATPDEAKAQSRRLASELFDKAMRLGDVGNTAVAAVLDRNRRVLQAWRDTDDKAVPNLAAILRMPPSVRKLIAKGIDELDGRYPVELPESADIANDFRLAARLQKESSDVIVDLLEALADHVMTRSEGVKLEQLCDELLGVVLAVRERAKLAQREGVVGITRLKVSGEE